MSRRAAIDRQCGRSQRGVRTYRQGADGWDCCGQCQCLGLGCWPSASRFGGRLRTVLGGRLLAARSIAGMPLAATEHALAAVGGVRDTCLLTLVFAMPPVTSVVAGFCEGHCSPCVMCFWDVGLLSSGIDFCSLLHPCLPLAMYVDLQRSALPLCPLWLTGLVVQ